MDEKDFELLRVLSETRNITHAAEKLFLTQSALSKRIKAIEVELGTKILLRSRQGSRFTPAGEEVLARSTAAAGELNKMRQTLQTMEQEVCGTLNAGISVNYALYRLPEVLAAYHAAYPRVNLHITTGQSRHLYQQMLKGDLDVGILRGEYAWDGMKFLISREKICVICRQEDAKRPLSEYMYVSHKTDSTLDAMMARWMREQGITPQTGLHVDNVTTCVEMVRRGLGWGLLPEIGLDDFSGCVRPCTFENGEPFVRRTSLLCQQEARRLPQVEAFIKVVKEMQKARIS